MKLLCTSDAFETAVKLIKLSEGLSLNAYKDGGGVITIGYGNTQNVMLGDVWTLAQCEANIQGRVRWFMDQVLMACPILATQPPYQLLACTSLCYNIGVGAFSKSTLAKYINAKSFSLAPAQFLRWCMDNGVAVAGLTKRRNREMQMFLTGQCDV